MAVDSLEQLRALFSRHGVERVFIKLLSPKQDNDKNQVYLGSSDNGVFTLFPGKFSIDGLAASESSAKRHSKRGDPKPCMALDFFWINAQEDTVHHAKNTKIIEYPQFPEARMSGFLSGADWVPDCMRRSSLHKYGSRALALGSNRQGQTFGLAMTNGIDVVFDDLSSLPKSGVQPDLLFEYSVRSSLKTDQEQLLDELKSLADIWHPSSIRRSGGGVSPFRGPAGAGNTLESLLEINANAKKEPDKYGFEIKSYKQGGKISLMTPTADKGFEGEHSFREFMNEYGWRSVKDPTRLVFNGIYRYLKVNKGTNIMLDMLGFDSTSQKFADDVTSIMPFLAKENDDRIISGWSFEKLYASWTEKHAKACYVEYESRDFEGDKTLGHDKEYRYTGTVYICEGTSIYKYLKAIANQAVYYDPAHDIKIDKSPSVRPQWRIAVTRKGFRLALEQLYSRVKMVELIER